MIPNFFTYFLRTKSAKGALGLGLSACILLLLNSSQAFAEGAITTSDHAGLSEWMVPIKGTVVDSLTGEPMAGVSISVQGENVGATTNELGQFSLEASQPAILEIRFLGYQTKRVEAREASDLRVLLAPSATNLDQLVVIGYGTQKRMDVSSSIASVKMADVDMGAALTGTQLLKGRVPGAQITSTGGVPGEKPIVLVRGIGSITGGSQPLYVVDGIPVDHFPNLNPADIETMEVLKDAAASAIYGSRANNGVVMITTRTGTEGPTQIHLQTKYGIGKIYHDIPMANSAEYIRTMQAAVDNYNDQMGTQLDFYVPSQIDETDWLKEVQRNSAHYQSIHLDVSGGTDHSSYYTSFGMLSQQGIMRSSEYKQYNFRAKLSNDLSRYLKLNVNLSGSAAPQTLLEQGDISMKNLRNAREEQPWYSPYNPDGSYKVDPPLIRHNPVNYYKEEHWRRKTYEGLGLVSLEVNPIKGLKYIPSVGIFAQFIDENKKITDLMDSRRTSAGWGAVAQDRNTVTHFTVNNLLSYEGTLGKLNYSALVGHSYEKYSGLDFGFYSSNYANNAYPSSSLDLVTSGAGIFFDPSKNDYQAYNLESYFGRLNLNYDNRYLLSASLRSDGSSRFSEAHRYGTFPAVSLGWNISEEAFWQSNSLISDLKLRISYGSTGSMMGIGNYGTRSLAASGNAYNGQGSLVLTQDGQDLAWEKAHELDLGLDWSLFHNRLHLIVDYFYQKTNNLLFERPIYATSGHSAIPSNIGSLNNQGLELSLDAQILSSGDFKWSAAGNISFIKNKLAALYGNTTRYVIPQEGWNSVAGVIHALSVGDPVSSFYMYKMDGIYQEDSEVPQKLYDKGVRAGDVKYQDLNGDGDITEADKQIVGNTIPKFYGGLTTRLDWKQWSLNVFAQYSVGSKIFASWRGVNEEGTENLGQAASDILLENGHTVEQFFNISKEAANTYWHGPGTSNSMPRPIRHGVFTGYASSYNQMESTRFLEDGSYFKIKTVTLSYRLPVSLARKLQLSRVGLFFTVDNALTFTKYSGYDPEASFSTNPGASNYGVDFGEEAALRNFVFGIDVNF